MVGLLPPRENVAAGKGTEEPEPLNEVESGEGKGGDPLLTERGLFPPTLGKREFPTGEGKDRPPPGDGKPSFVDGNDPPGDGNRELRELNELPNEG